MVRFRNKTWRAEGRRAATGRERNVALSTSPDRRSGRLEQILDALDAFVVLLDGEGRVTHAGASALRSTGLTGDAVLGRFVWEAFGGADSSSRCEALRGAVSAARAGRPAAFDLPEADGERTGTQAEAPVRLRATPVQDETGAVVEIVVSDIPVQARTAVERSQSELRSVLDRTLALVAVIDQDGRVSDVNAAAATLFGLDRDTVIAAPFMEMLWTPAGESSDLVGEAVDLALQGQGVRFDVEFVTPSGRTGVLDLMLSPECDADGAVRRVIASAFDITERKEAAERIELLLQEVNHRSKNLLGLVQAVARQTRGGDFAEYRDKFQRRLAGLSAAQDLVTAHDWGDVKLAALIENQLGAFSGETGGRITLDGPMELNVSARVAQTLGMAIHELVTKAGKYGALSRSSGTVTIRWRREPDGLSLRWTERGGPAVRKPDSTGFGSLVIDQVVADAVGGRVSIDYAPEGLDWRLTGARTGAAPAAAPRR